MIKVSGGAVIKNANLFHLYPQFNFLRILKSGSNDFFPKRRFF